MNGKYESFNTVTLLVSDKPIKEDIELIKESYKDFYKNCFVLSMGDKNNLFEIANNLFDCLREFDLNQIDIVYAESIDEKELGSAIMNRLLKSAAYKKIRA